VSSKRSSDGSHVFGQSLRLCSTLLLMLAIAGCSEAPQGPQRAAVSGTVLFNGAPLVQGIIRFVPTDGTEGPKVSLPIQEGHFAADTDHGPVAGTNRIEIQSTDDGGLAMDDEEAVEQLQRNPRKISILTIPSIYNTRSQLKEQLLTDQLNEFNFELQTPRRR